MASPRRAADLVLVLAAALAGGGRATMLDTPPPERRLVLSGWGAFQSNPVGLSAGGKLSLRQRLFQSEELALRDNFLSLGVSAALSPATGRAGVVAELQPLTVLTLYAAVEGLSYFGNFGALQSFPSAASDWSSQAMDALAQLPRGDPRRNYGATALAVTFGARLRLQAGPIALTDGAELVRSQASLRAGDRVYYDPIQAALVPQEGFTLTNDLDLVWVGKDGLVAGLRHTVIHPFFGARHYAPGDPQVSEAAQMRSGPLLAYRFFKEDGRAFNAPTVFLLVNWWLQHRYRTGAEVSQAVPYIVFGLGFFGDLLGVAPHQATGSMR